MRVCIQRVRHCRLSIGGSLFSEIGHGLLVLVGIEATDTDKDIEWLCGKISRLRIFDDGAGVMNLDVNQVGGEVMAVSQFTLYASTHKGNRPSYIRSAPEAFSRPMYEQFVEALAKCVERHVARGEFGADMQIELLNDGPVTIIIDSKQRE